MNLSPFEGEAIGIVGLDESFNVGDEVGDAGETGPAERLAAEDGKPDLDLIEPGGMRGGEVKVEPRVLLPKAWIGNAMSA